MENIMNQDPKHEDRARYEALLLQSKKMKRKLLFVLGGVLAGILLWDRSFGRWLIPVFSSFWKGFFLIFSKISLPLKNFSAKCKKFGKNLFASRKKEAIIKWNNRQHLRRRTGGNSHGK